MLVLTRKPGQKFRILPGKGIDPNLTVRELFEKGPIEIIVTQIQGMQVKLGITAPREVLVLRDELVDAPPPRPADPV